MTGFKESQKQKKTLLDYPTGYINFDGHRDEHYLQRAGAE
jgi:hypothetical protein